MVDHEHKFSQVGYPAILISSPFLISSIIGLYLGTAETESMVSLGIICIGAFAFMVFYGRFTVIINPHEIQWCFGLGLLKKKISLERIYRAEIVRDTEINKFGIIRTNRGMLFNASGREAIRLHFRTTPEETAIVELGTDKPEKLCSLVNQYLAIST